MISALVVDDDKEVRDFLKMLLEREFRCSVVLASSAEWTLNFSLVKKAFDIIFFDYKLLGGMDGIDLLHKLRKNGEKSVMVMISAYIDSVDKVYEACHARGYDYVAPDEFLAKPFTRGQLAELVNRYFP